MNTNTTKKYCLIGDLHGRIDTLERILDKSQGYYYILLGDTIHHKPFFKRTKRTSPVRILTRIKQLTDSGQATLLIGNNENYILKNLILPKTQIKQKEVRYTLECFKALELEQRLSLLSWLNTSPLTLEFESYGYKYRCSHAYYLPNYTSANRNEVLHGIGYPWFKQDNLHDHIKDDARYFFGHYGYPYFRKNLHIIDATNFEGVGVYYTDREEFMVYY